MRKLLEALVTVAFLAAPAAAHAQLQLGVRIGGAFPWGDVERGYPLGDLAARTLPVGLEVGWRFFGRLTVGARGEYGFGAVEAAQERDCQELGATCSISTIRTGIQVSYAFRPASRFDPWLGLGAGYEWLRYRVENVGVDASLEYRGFEWVRAQAGLDFRLERFTVGPYLSFGLGTYTHRSLDLPDARSETGTDRAKHGWLEMGARGTFTF